MATSSLAPAALAVVLGTQAHADQLPTSAFQTYSASSASSIVAGPYALYIVPVSQILPTQLNVGYTEIDKKADGYNVVTTRAGAVSLSSAIAALESTTNLLTSIEPVVIGPGGVLYQTDGHHTFRALDSSAFGASNPNVYVNVIANFSNLTEAQFLTAMEADNLLFPVNVGTFTPVNLSTGSPLPTSLLGMTSDPYRALEYSILKNKNSKLFTTTSNVTGAVGSAKPGLDKNTGFYSDFVEAGAYRGANGGLGLPYLSPTDITISTNWNLKGTNVTTGLPGFSSLNVNQLPGYILPTNIVITGAVTDTLIQASGNAQLGALAGVTGTFDESSTFASFTGLRYTTFSSGGQSVQIGTVQGAGNGPGFLLQLGNDLGGTVTLSGTNTYTGGTYLVAGTLIITGDASLGATALSNAISTSSVVTGVEADNGIVFNSLAEGAATIQIGLTATPGTNSFTESRPIAIEGEAANINLNGNTLTLASQLYSTGALSTGISNQTGENDITIEDLSSSANGTLVLSSTANNSTFFGNWVITSGTLLVSNDTSLGNTTGSSYQIGQIELNGGTLKAGASFSSVRSLFLQSGSTYDTAGFTTSWSGNLQDVQRTLTIANSNATKAGSVSFGSSEFASTAILSLDAGSATSTTGGAGVTVNLGTITRDGNFANAAAEATLFINPATGTTLGTSGTNSARVFASGTAATNTNGIAPVWIVSDNGASAGSNPYNFLTYHAANGYQVATYTTGLTGSTATSVIDQTANITLSGATAAYALKLDNGKTITATGQTLTIGDGTHAAGLILEGSTGITGGTLAFGGSEAVITAKSSTTISSALTGTAGLTLDGSGTVTLTGTIGGLSGPINVDSGTLQLKTTDTVKSGTQLWLSDVKSKPSNAILQISTNQILSGLDSDGTNSAVNIDTGMTLTVGDTTNNYNSTLLSVITGTGTGSLVKAGSGMLDLSSGGGATFGTGGTVTVQGGALRIGNGVFGTSATTAISVASGAELQYSGNGGSAFNDPVSGAGIFHLLAGTVKLTGTNTYTGGTVIEDGATLDVTPTNLPTGGNIINAGGVVDFDTSNSTGGTFSGVISDGNEAGGSTDLNDMSAGSCGSGGASNNPAGPACLSGNLIKDDSTDNGSTSNVTLTAQQQYSGYTAIEAGTLTLGAGSSIASSSGVVLGRVGGMMAGSDGGGLTISQTAGLILATNSTIQTLSSVPAAAGSQVNANVFVQLAGKTLTITPPSGFQMTFGGNIQDSGSGSLVLNGAGMEILDGANTVGGSTVVTKGSLQIGDTNTPTATLTSPTVTVGASGVLLGHGTITGAITNSAGGTVQPGGSIGTMTVVGSYTQGSNSTLAIELNPTTSSTLAVTGAANIAGTLLLMPDAGTYSRGTSYQFITATGGVTGNFSTVTSSNPLYVFAASGSGGNLTLTLTSFAALQSLTTNQQAAFGALNSAAIGSGTDSLLNIVGNLTGSAQTRALDQLNGYSAAASVNTMSASMSNVQDALGNRAAADSVPGTNVQVASLATDITAPVPSRYTVWGQGLGNFSSVSGSSGAPGQSTSIGGGLIGVDTALDRSTRVGVSFGTAVGNTSVQNLGQSSKVSTYTLGLYAGRWYGPVGIDAEAIGAYASSSASRVISVTGNTASGRTSGFGGGFSGTVRYRVNTTVATIEPQLGLSYSYNQLGRYTESGAGAANLTVGQVSQNSLRSAAGIEAFKSFSSSLGYTFVPEVRAAWLHQFLDTSTRVNQSFAASAAAFSTNSANWDRNAAQLEAGVSFKRPGGNVSFYAQYDATLSGRMTDHAIRGGLAVSW